VPPGKLPEELAHFFQPERLVEDARRTPKHVFERIGG
jgi:hypothetical protein